MWCGKFSLKPPVPFWQSHSFGFSPARKTSGRGVALDTVFRVSLDREGLAVAVTEGRVELDELATAARPPEAAGVGGAHQPPKKSNDHCWKP